MLMLHAPPRRRRRGRAPHADTVIARGAARMRRYQRCCRAFYGGERAIRALKLRASASADDVAGVDDDGAHRRYAAKDMRAYARATSK